MRWTWYDAVAWLLAAFFVVGAVGNTVAGEQIAADYARWGYPGGFNYLTAILEFAAAVLLLRRSSRRYGAGLGAAVMTAASATVLWHGEFAHALAPLAVLAVSLFVAWSSLGRNREALSTTH